MTDNGPQFASTESIEFSKRWEFDHVTSSPRYPQSNDKGENAVKTVKRLFKKCQESGESEYLALLDWRNTPTEGFGTSPAQRFLGQRCKTRLPTQRSLLAPRYSTEGDAEALQSQNPPSRSATMIAPVGKGNCLHVSTRTVDMEQGQVYWTGGATKLWGAGRGEGISA